MPLEVVFPAQQAAKSERGGEMLILLSPRTVKTQSGFMGTLTLHPQDLFRKHYHPYSDEYLYIITGEISITDEQETRIIQAGTGVFIPRNVPHSLQNQGIASATIVFFATPLAPRPELGHVLVEE